MIDVPHRLSVRVYFEDTDAGGVVYHASYFRFAERARTEFLRSLGYDHRTLLENHDGHVLVRRATADFLAPARLDDLLEVQTEIRALGAATAVFHQTVRRGSYSSRSWRHGLRSLIAAAARGAGRRRCAPAS